MGIAPVDSPRGPTEDIVNVGGTERRVGLERRAVRAEVISVNEDVGVRGGRLGVRRPCFGSVVSAVVPWLAQFDWMRKAIRGDLPDTATPMVASRDTSRCLESPVVLTRARRIGCSSRARSIALIRNVKMVVRGGDGGKSASGSRASSGGMSEARYVGREGGGAGRLRVWM